MEMMLQWKTELEEVVEKEIDAIEKIIVGDLSYTLNKNGRSKLKVLIQEFGFGVVYDASEIAERQYFWMQDRIQKIGGICYNIRKKREESGH